jgi:hypothetical protein
MPPKFTVYVRHGDMRAHEALVGAGFQPAGPSFDAEYKQQTHELADAIQVRAVTARSPEHAGKKVKGALPEDGDYIIERVEPAPD